MTIPYVGTVHCDKLNTQGEPCGAELEIAVEADEFGTAIRETVGADGSIICAGCLSDVCVNCRQPDEKYCRSCWEHDRPDVLPIVFCS